MIKNDRLDVVRRAVSAVIGEAVMVGGYFLYEATVLGYGMGATASLVGNTLQGVCGVVLGTLVFTALKKPLHKIL